VPNYEYRCNANGSVVEVQHKMAERISTWGELCDRAGIPRGKTSAKARDEKLMSAGFVGTSSRQSPASAPCEAPMCGTGGCGSGGGMCPMN